MYPFTNALHNIHRQYKRYRVLVPLILVCALLSGMFMSLAVPCRLYSEQRNKRPPVDFTEETILHIEQADRVRELGESASMLQFGIVLVGTISLLYVSCLMINERIFDIGILYAIGLSRRQIFLSLLIELSVLCSSTIIIGLCIGRAFAVWYLEKQIALQTLPEDLLLYINGGMTELLCILAAFCILLLPIAILGIKLLQTEPAELLRNRK